MRGRVGLQILLGHFVDLPKSFSTVHTYTHTVLYRIGGMSKYLVSITHIRIYTHNTNNKLKSFKKRIEVWNLTNYCQYSPLWQETCCHFIVNKLTSDPHLLHHRHFISAISAYQFKRRTFNWAEFSPYGMDNLHDSWIIIVCFFSDSVWFCYPHTYYYHKPLECSGKGAWMCQGKGRWAQCLSQTLLSKGFLRYQRLVVVRYKFAWFLSSGKTDSSFSGEVKPSLPLLSWIHDIISETYRQ